MPHTVACHPCRGHPVPKCVRGPRCKIVLGGVGVATSSQTIENRYVYVVWSSPLCSVRTENFGEYPWCILTNWGSNVLHDKSTIYVVSVHSAQGHTYLALVCEWVRWRGSPTFELLG